MCPKEERSRLGNNPRKIDVLEESLDLSISAMQEENDGSHILDHKYTMIKKYEKSSADREMALPHLVRTPSTLLETIDYMEQNVMDVDRQVHLIDDDDDDDQGDSNDAPSKGPDKYHVHNFVWDRMRSIYGDFIVQNYRLGGRVDPYCIECHERMARWHLMMEHHMQWNSESHAAGFDRQNSERYISILKSLDEFYNMVHLLEETDFVDPPNGTNRPFPIPNEGELRSYFILYQMDNQGASDKYLKNLRPDVIDHPDIQFALKAMQARRSENFGMYFRLLRESNYLQACALFRFVAPMRLHALRVINKVMRAGKKEVAYPVRDLQEQLCFNDADDAIEYLSYFGFDVSSSDNDDLSDCNVFLHGNPLEFRKDEDGKEIAPPLQYMTTYIESKLGSYDRADVCRGLLSNAVNFNGDVGDIIVETLSESGDSPEETPSPEHTKDASQKETRVELKTPSIVQSIREKSKRGISVTR